MLLIMITTPLSQCFRTLRYGIHIDHRNPNSRLVHYIKSFHHPIEVGARKSHSQKEVGARNSHSKENDQMVRLKFELVLLNPDFFERTPRRREDSVQELQIARNELLVCQQHLQARKR